MEECTICGENAEYKCTPCNIVLCKIHKHDHKRMEQSEHLIIKIAKNLSSEKNPIFMDNFLMNESQSEENSSLSANPFIHDERVFNKSLFLESQITPSIGSMDKQNSNILSSEIPNLFSQPNPDNAYSFPSSLGFSSIPNRPNLFPQTDTDITLGFPLFQGFSSIPNNSLNSETNSLSAGDSCLWSQVQYKKYDSFDLHQESRSISTISSMDTEEASHFLVNEYNLYIESHLFPVTSLAITSDSKHLVCVCGFALTLWNLNDKRQEAALEGHEREINSIAIMNDNLHIVSASDDQTVRIWSLQHKRQEAVLNGHYRTVTTVAVTSDDKYIISASSEANIII